MSQKYYITPPGIASYPWINSPDTKFNIKGLYKVDLVLSGEAASALRAKVDAAIDAAFIQLTSEMTAKDAKSYEKDYPYEVETDDDDKPTGNTIFHFRQNAKITLKSGEEKVLKIAIRDSNDKETNVRVTPGSELRVMYAMRAYPAKSTKKISVRLDFMKVQVIKLGSGSDSGFGAYEGGYVDDGEQGAEQGFGSATGADAGSADY